MFDTAKIYVSAHTHLIAEKTKTVASSASKQTQEFTSDHKSELTAAAATAFVVGLAARAAGFKAGYAFAKIHDNHTA
jgi:ribosomal protein L18